MAITLTFLGVMLLALVVADGQKFERKMEEKTDQAVATHIMRKNDLTKITIHSRTYRLGDHDEK